MKDSARKKPTRKILESNPAILHDLPARLSELEAEIRTYPSRPVKDRSLKSIKQPHERTMGKDRVVQFQIRKNVFGAGHTDVSSSGSNHARGVRHVRLYWGEKLVLDIEGDYEDQQLGSNFRFQNILVFEPGVWVEPFVKLTEEFRNFKAKRKMALYKKRTIAG
jgi:hypothetical protein